MQDLHKQIWWQKPILMLNCQVLIENSNPNKSKHLLAANEFKKLKIFDSSYFRGKSRFGEDVTQNYLVFQPMYRYFKVIANAKYISEWKSKGLSDESIKPPSISDNKSFSVDWLS